MTKAENIMVKLAYMSTASRFDKNHYLREREKDYLELTDEQMKNSPKDSPYYKDWLAKQPKPKQEPKNFWQKIKSGGNK